jgi:hypothetical protein
MPYKRVGKKILVRRGRKWVPLKVHKTMADAIRHLRALKLNVRH